MSRALLLLLIAVMTATSSTILLPMKRKNPFDSGEQNPKRRKNGDSSKKTKECFGKQPEWKQPENTKSLKKIIAPDNLEKMSETPELSPEKLREQQHTWKQPEDRTSLKKFPYGFFEKKFGQFLKTKPIRISEKPKRYPKKLFEPPIHYNGEQPKDIKGLKKIIAPGDLGKIFKAPAPSSEEGFGQKHAQKLSGFDFGGLKRPSSVNWKAPLSYEGYLFLLRTYPKIQNFD